MINNVLNYTLLLITTLENLNYICKKHTNSTDYKLIAQQILNEAKRLLIYTENTIAEIGYSLGFTDKSIFRKLFKRHMQITPQQFISGRL